LEAVLAIASREGWPAKYRNRDGFDVIQSDRMAKVLTAGVQAEYTATFTPANWKAVLAAPDGRLAA
jgi:hypothetical protein